MLPDPLCELRHLRIMSRKLPIAHYASFVDALVELFPCVKALSLRTSDPDISIEFDEDRDFTWSWKAYIDTSNSDEYDRNYQSVKEAIDEIVELLSWTEEDSSENGSSASEYSEMNVE
ncbi:hypothetical protein TorRG33x02_320040 [Trema orientale]|uniref:Uncharacterized protein n=1 Tax=Trema orientale TaxID=63057 RepID=A0A2P5BIE0_TREOI|nr:hypothetical protein TorRG33x02_320040 [Trema orientale]